MAINKNDYLDGEGNYDLKKALIDEIIDEFNTHVEKFGFELVENENGICLRYENGYQLCVINAFQLGWKDSMQLTANWVYPLPFIERPTVVATKNNSGSNPTLRRSAISIDRETSYCAILLDAQVGETFNSGQSAAVYAFAFGKWK